MRWVLSFLATTSKLAHCRAHRRGMCGHQRHDRAHRGPARALWRPQTQRFRLDSRCGGLAGDDSDSRPSFTNEATGCPISTKQRRMTPTCCAAFCGFAMGAIGDRGCKPSGRRSMRRWNNANGRRNSKRNGGSAMVDKQKIAVVGGGLGGLAAACTLAARDTK